ncbi:hypothetical protein IQ22_01599 [Pseudomonas duriflava]|uniref:Uncharacterized protein n=1 Tax=Pseudomonas duriflava TaxID=459528 RepID=A0A562QHJ9_9PSED|nr:hypothetical protein [Pseudomonas duriflava]TWI55670.1 hypothetical protein IQ22_01599 [Pseudomonas duriflava]
MYPNRLPETRICIPGACFAQVWKASDDNAPLENVPGGSYDVDEDFVTSVGDEEALESEGESEDGTQ